MFIFEQLQVEFFVFGLFLFYFANFLLKSKQNTKIAICFIKATKELFKGKFEHCGISEKTSLLKDGLFLLTKGPANFIFYASGSKLIKHLLVNVEVFVF